MPRSLAEERNRKGYDMSRAEGTIEFFHSTVLGQAFIFYSFIVMIPCLWGSRLIYRVLDSLYVPSASGIGMLFFDEQMYSGNILLGFICLFFVFILYSLALGVLIHLFRKYYSRHRASSAASKIEA